MKLLNYNNYFYFIFDLLFRPKKVLNSLDELLDKKQKALEDEMNEKIELLHYQQYENGIVLSNVRQYPVLEIPIYGMEKPDYWIGSAQVQEMTIEKRQLVKIQTS